MDSYKEDKILFYIPSGFGKKPVLVEKYIERGDDVVLKHYINMFMTTKWNGSYSRSQDKAPFLPY